MAEARENDREGRQARALGAQGERTRRRLLEAAKKAFGERGYQATRVDDITGGAGTSHGAFYLYFRNKQDVLETLARETAEGMYELADRLDGMERGERGYEDLRQWVAEFVGTYADNAAVITAWTQAADDPRFDRLGREVLGRFAGKIADVIARHVEADLRHPVHPGIAATALVAMLERVSFFWLVRGPRLPHDAAVDTLASILYETIFGERPA